MNNQITLVTAPDEVYHNAVRILLVDLNEEQTQSVSSALMTYDTIPPVVVYVWKISESVEWLLDKKLKSQLIVFNADSEKLDIVGYFAGVPNSFYFGGLKDLSIVNKRNIYSADDFKEIVDKKIKVYTEEQAS